MCSFWREGGLGSGFRECCNDGLMGLLFYETVEGEGWEGATESRPIHYLHPTARLKNQERKRRVARSMCFFPLSLEL